MIQRHTVRQNESLAVIAKKYGFPSWEAIYHHPLNKPFRTLRPKPHLIHIGDVLIIPDKSSQGGKSFEEYMVRVMTLEEEAIRQRYSFQDRVTAFRLIHYPNRPVKEYGGTTLGGGPWPLIIPGAAHVELPSSWNKEPFKTMVAYLQQNVKLEIHGMLVDIGHLWTGLDARLRPSKVKVTVAGIAVIELRSNQEAATYVGDLGSVVAEYAPAVVLWLWEKANKATAAFQKAYAGLAGEADMAGNIDSYSMPLDTSRAVTLQLLDYYLAESGGVRKRYSTFVDKVRLTFPETRQALEKEIFSAAQLVLAGDKKFVALKELYELPGAALERPRATIYSEVVKLTLDTFTQACQTKAKSE